MQLEFFDVPSPCIGICQSDTKGYCLGCFRTREERQNWIDLSNDDKQKVIKRCITRKRRKDTKNKPKEHKIAVQDITENDLELQQPSLLDPPIKKNIDIPTDFDFNDFEL
ncbi:MAG: DUF1289 domain-containing protein [Gammaproteobacteria bacterium]|nr:MAG: DUF1289 domain-containing protein [Gammaproteobacteria bacterium]